MGWYASVAEYRRMREGIYRGIKCRMPDMRPAAGCFERLIDHFGRELVGAVLQPELFVCAATDLNKPVHGSHDAGTGLQPDAAYPRCAAAGDVIGPCPLRVLQGRPEIAGLIAPVQAVSHQRCRRDRG